MGLQKFFKQIFQQKKKLNFISGSDSLLLKSTEAIAFCKFKGQIEHLDLFINYHLNMGFSHIVVLNLSKLDLSKSLKNLQSVTLYECKNFNSEDLTSTINDLNKVYSKDCFSLSLEEDELFHYLYADTLSLEDFLTYLNENQFLGTVAHEIPVDKPKELNMSGIKGSLEKFKVNFNGVDFKTLDSGTHVLKRGNEFKSKLCLSKLTSGLNLFEDRLRSEKLSDMTTLVLKLEEIDNESEDLEAKKHIRSFAILDSVIQDYLSEHFPVDQQYIEFAEKIVFDRVNLKNYLDAYIPRLAVKNNQYQKFLILGIARTGTTYLSSLLKSLSNVVCAHELFNQKKIFDDKHRYINDNLVLPAFRKQDPLNFLNQIFWHDDYEANIQAVGFKILSDQFVSFPDLNKLLTEGKDIKVIFCQRRNSLKRLYSEKQARLFDQWNLRSKDKRINSPISLELETCQRVFQGDENSNQKTLDLLKSNNIDFVDIFYEDLNKDCSKEMQRISNLLGIRFDESELKSDFVKQNVKPLNEVIDNYAELKQFFGSTKWSYMFEE